MTRDEVPQTGSGHASRTAFTPGIAALANMLLLVVALGVVHVMARGALWSPYYKITVGQEGV